MSRKNLLMASAGAVVGAIVFNAKPAWADLPTIDVITHFLLQQAQNAITQTVTNVEHAVTNIGTNIANTLTGVGNNLNDTLTNGFTQNANYAKAAVGAQQQIADGSNMANAAFQRAVRNAQLRDEHTMSPQACVAVNSGQTVTVAAGQAWRVRQAIGNITDRRGQALPGTPAYQGQAQAAAAISQLHLSRYCNENESSAGLCTLNAERQNLDQSAGALLAVSAYNPDSGVDAANDFATNAVQPIVPAAMRGDALTSVAGQDAEARRRGYNAKMSLARDVANGIIATRTNSVNLNDDEKRQMTAEGLTPTDQSSWLGSLELEVNRRSSGVEWHASLQSMTPKAVMVEVASELAMSNYIALAQYKLSQQHAMVSASQLATAAEAELKPTATMPSPTMASQ